MASKKRLPKGKVFRGRPAGILLEDLDSKLDLIIEKVEGSEQRLTERIDGLEVRMDRIESEIVGIRVLLGQQDETLKRHEQDISLLKAVAQH